ncbi:MAG: DEAD/DEAH box helicase [Lachnospiraceae bacterium]|nr:DEAD/DEAH box helicase [Lachnospiraceae bacterium]
MEKTLMHQIEEGMSTAFIDMTRTSNLAYKPQFVSNNYKEGRKVLSSIEDELLSCDEFFISVAFITMSGITPLLQTLKELEKRNVHGKIMTTDYLMFSEPKALDKLAELENIELRMYCSEKSGEGFHTKGYIFREKEIYRIVVGSSNMTLNALTRNKEWNTRLISTNQGEYTQQIIEEYNELWNSIHTISYEKFIENYRTKYLLIKKQKAIAKQADIPVFEQYRLQPNKMQVEFINNLQKIKNAGAKRALLISATGTGKTYASAFAVREDNPHKILFIVHREQIAKQAVASYKRVFGTSKKFGLLSGNAKDYDADYLFSTMQMMAKAETLEHFKRDEFETIVIDEVHRVGAESYQKILNYFLPQFWLGMTASPERTDGFDIYTLFDHNIAYEIRLQQALEENLLCPFHYFGITDLEIDGEIFDDNSGVRNFARLVSDERVDYVLEQAKFYGHSGDKVKGLVFCSSKKEAVELSDKFNKRGYHTVALCGEDSQEKREECIERISSDSQENCLDYIFTIDIFNEGVDIPAINQVIMLRPTKSPIVFVQQLGRGLRKADNKEYVVILDFIGNYMNNFMIPIALSGDRSYNKDTIRRYVREGAKIIPGSSTIHFDEISKKRIFQSIDVANFNDIRLIKESYQELKYKLGRVPNLMDFEKYGSIDPIRMFDNKSLGSYHKFLSKYEKEYTIEFSTKQENVLEYISKKFASGKRVHELLAIKRLMAYQHELMKYLRKDLKEEHCLEVTQKTETNIVNILTNEFTTGSAKDTYSDCVLIEPEDNDYKISGSFEEMLRDEHFYQAVNEVVEFGLYRNRKDYGKPYKDTVFQLYAKYTYEDVCRLLEWEKGEVALNIGGYKYDKRTKTYPVFINYDKTEDIADTIKYEDRLETPSMLIAISKSGRSLESEDVYTALHAKELGVSMELFIRKNKDDKISKEFYYLGKIYATGKAHEFIMPNTNKKAVEIQYMLETPVREDLYDYIVS